MHKKDASSHIKDASSQIKDAYSHLSDAIMLFKKGKMLKVSGREREAYYHTVIYLVLELLGANIQVEVHTNKGRIDAVIETAGHIYIMEFKMGTSAEALAQIKERKYHEKYVSTGKLIRLIGVGFDEKESH